MASGSMSFGRSAQVEEHRVPIVCVVHMALQLLARLVAALDICDSSSILLVEDNNPSRIGEDNMTR